MTALVVSLSLAQHEASGSEGFLSKRPEWISMAAMSGDYVLVEVGSLCGT